MLSIVVYYCPHLFFVFLYPYCPYCKDFLFSLQGSYCPPSTYCFQLQTLFCLVCRTHALLSGHRTIALRCISSVTCTPWFISSLNCCTRSVAYSLSNEISPLNCCTRHFISAYLLDPTCHGRVLFFPYLCLFY